MSQGMLGIALSEVRGLLNDLMDKLCGPQGRMWLAAFKRFLCRENPWTVPMMFTVTTNGRTGEQFITALGENGYRVGDYAKELLRSDSFVATDGVTYNLVVISGDEFEDAERMNANIRAVAASCGYLVPPMEVAPYVREMFSDEDLQGMGLRGLIVMHEPVTVSDGELSVLGAGRAFDGRWLETCRGRPDVGQGRGFSFVFLDPQQVA